MGAQDPKTLWIRPFFDVSQPYLYVLVLPPLILFALGLRRIALLYFVGATVAMVILGAA